MSIDLPFTLSANINRIQTEMSKNKQLEKNIELSGKLAEYIAANPSVVKSMPNEASFVVFSTGDKKLNEANKGLIASLKNEGKKVIKATQKSSKTQPWSFSVAI